MNACRTWGAALSVVPALASAGCDLTEVSLADPEDVIIAEAHVILTLRSGGPGDPGGRVEMAAPTLLHRTYGDGPRSVPGAVVRIAGASGRVVQLLEGRPEDCVVLQDENPFDLRFDGGSGGTCYRAPPGVVPFAPGEELSLEVRAPGGQVLTAASRVPGAFAFAEPLGAGAACRVEPDANHVFGWTTPADVWTYLAEAEIAGLREPLSARGIESADTVYLLGLAVGREESRIVFPRQLGVLQALGDEQDADVLVALQDGLPAGVRATVSVAAVDRNWTNWARGGSFNPSGDVRTSSVLGDGAGVFGTAVQRLADVVSGPAGGDAPPPLCAPVETAR